MLLALRAWHKFASVRISFCPWIDQPEEREIALAGVEDGQLARAFGGRALAGRRPRATAGSAMLPVVPHAGS